MSPPPDCRLPITPVLFHTFHTFLDTSYSDQLTLWAAMLVAFFGFLRNTASNGPLLQFQTVTALTRHRVNHLVQEVAAYTGVKP